MAVLDTNALANAACFEASSGHESLVTRLVQTGRVPCFIADHVPAEIAEHLPRIARTQGTDPVAAFEVWEHKISPLLRVVELPIGEYLRPEIATIRDPRRGDLDDWPTLALAAFLAPAQVVARDAVFHRLGYANDDEDWTVTAGVLRRAAQLEGEQIERVFMSIMTGRILWAGGAGLVRLGQRLPWALPFVGAGALLLAWRTWELRAGVRAFIGDAREALAPHWRRIMEDLAEQAELRASLAGVEDPPWRTESLVERCARYLARSGDPMTTGELRDALAPGSLERISAAGIERAIAGHPSFQRLPGRRYQIGRGVDCDVME